MKYAANQRRISSFVKIVNFVRQARAKDQICLMAVSSGTTSRFTKLGSFCYNNVTFFTQSWIPRVIFQDYIQSHKNTLQYFLYLKPFLIGDMGTTRFFTYALNFIWHINCIIFRTNIK